jgi:putative component of membrane protein insertase Oxa1/YidC/SpoIIIJ protein YidD
VIVVVLQLVLQLSNVVNSNPAHGKVYSIHHYVTKCVSDLRQVGGFPVSSTNKTDHHDITDILLKLALNTIILTLTLYTSFLPPCITYHCAYTSRVFVCSIYSITGINRKSMENTFVYIIDRCSDYTGKTN